MSKNVIYRYKPSSKQKEGLGQNRINYLNNAWAFFKRAVLTVVGITL
jgi:hypothetical protein